MHRLALRAAAAPRILVQRRVCIVASVTRFAARGYAADRQPPPSQGAAPPSNASASRLDTRPQQPSPVESAAETSEGADAEARIYDKDGNAIDLDSLPEGWRRAVETHDIDHLSPAEQKRFLEWVNEHGDGSAIVPFDELPENWQQAVRSNDTSHLSGEELADFEAYREAQRNLGRVSVSDLPSVWRHALETGDMSQLSEEGQKELSTFLETTEIVTEEQDDLDIESLPESWRRAIETGETDHLTDAEAEELAYFLESQSLDGAEPAQGSSGLPAGLPSGWMQALETGDTSGLSNQEKKEFFAFLQEQAVDDADPGHIPDDVPPHELALAALPERLQRAREADEVDKLDEDDIGRVYAAEDEWRPDEIPAHWLKALATGDESEIKGEELLAFRLASHNIAQDTGGYSSTHDVDPGNVRVPAGIVKALQTGDASGLSTRDAKRLQNAVHEIDNGSLDQAASKALSEGFGGGNLDPKGGPFNTMGRRVGPDDIFKPSEMKFLSDMRRLEAIERQTREQPRWMSEPEFIPKSHGIPVAVVHFRSHHLPLLELYIHFATHAAAALGIPCGRPAKLPNQRSLWTVPRSPFIYKKSQQNFHRITHKRAIKLWDANSEVVSFFADYIVRHSLGGVGIRIVRWDRAPLGVGEEIFFNAMKHPRSHREQLAQTSKKVIKAERRAAERLEELELLYAEKKRLAKKGSYPAKVALSHARRAAEEKGYGRKPAEEALVE